MSSQVQKKKLFGNLFESIFKFLKNKVLSFQSKNIVRNFSKINFKRFEIIQHQKLLCIKMLRLVITDIFYLQHSLLNSAYTLQHSVSNSTSILQLHNFNCTLSNLCPTPKFRPL